MDASQATVMVMNEPLPKHVMEQALAELRAVWTRQIAGKGAVCPCCNRFGKRYRRSINRTMAKCVAWLAAQRGDSDGWVDVPRVAPRWLVRSNQLPTMRWWGLVERIDPEAPGVNHSGMWRCTAAGRQFAMGILAVPKYVTTYNGEPLAFSEHKVFLAECGGPFDFAEIMKDAA